MAENPIERLQAQVLALEFLVSRLMARSMAATMSEGQEAKARLEAGLRELPRDSRSMIAPDAPEAAHHADLVETQTKRLLSRTLGEALKL